MVRKSVLLISNRRPEDSGGRAEKVATRRHLLEEQGWDVMIGHVPEPYVAEFPRRLVSVARTGRANDVDVVLSINNPFHLHIHGLLVSRLLRIPWVAEFRDPILSRPDLERKSLRWYLAAATERLTARYADRILWFDGIQIPDNYFESTYPKVPAEKFIKLPPMGYEKQKFEAATPIEYDQFTITYAGSFYKGWIEPYDFLSGFGRFFRKSSVDSDQLQTLFYGDWSAEYDQRVTEERLEDVVQTHDFIPHEEIVRVLKGSDILLYIGGDDPDNRRNIPSKIFDYIGARNPILAIVDPTFRVAEFLQKNHLGLVVEPGNDEALAAALERLWEGEIAFTPPEALFDRLTRQRTAKRIAETLDAVVEMKCT